MKDNTQGRGILAEKRVVMVAAVVLLIYGLLVYTLQLQLRQKAPYHPNANLFKRLTSAPGCLVVEKGNRDIKIHS